LSSVKVLEDISPSLQDYLEAIFHLEKTNRVARAKDIAAEMNVKRGTVTGALKALSEHKLINYSPYNYITLTPKGRRLAGELVQRHDILKEFFIMFLQLDPEVADANACRVEHAIDPLAFERLVYFVEFMKNCPRAGDDWLQAFTRFCHDGSQPDNCE
jgi:DtxR family transcriptional regulator, Mn-dependent transcriptional regulator